MLWPQPLQGGHRASSRPTAASFPEQEGAEKLRAGQAGGFPAVPTPKPHPVSLFGPVPPRSEKHLPTLTPGAGNLKRKQSPPLPGDVGEGKAAEPLPPAAPGSEALNE